MSLTLLDWRRRVAGLYADVRADAERDPAGALDRFRAGRHDLFTGHPDSPLRAGDAPPDYFPYDPALRFEVDVVSDVEPVRLAFEGTSEGTTSFVRIGRADLSIGSLDLWWLTAYGGGLFVPVADPTNRQSTYGGGRYLLDTVKGADLGGTSGRLVLDLNYAYFPSCAYDPAWSCPLAPPGNRLNEPVEAGERVARAGARANRLT